MGSRLLLTANGWNDVCTISVTLLQGADVSLVDWSATPQHKILTEVAQAVIQGALAEGKYEKRSGSAQPTYIAPSPDSTMYSSVCNSLTLLNTYDSSPTVVLPLQ